MALKDQFGCSVSTDDTIALRKYDAAVAKMITLSGDPVALVSESTDADPQFVMGHVLKALLCLLGTEKALVPDARRAMEAAQSNATGATERERRHINAIQAWLNGHFNKAVEAWEQILIQAPDDAVAMFAAHQGDFFLGQSSELRDRVARRLPWIDKGTALHGHYLGMYAFGLEETNNYTKAEDAGRQSVALCARDSWAIHAVAHVMEMIGRSDDGARWLLDRTDDWAVDNFFAVHNWWHLALYYIDQQRWEDALKLYDESLRATNSTAMLDMVDASALLWRLKLHGVDVGNRWGKLAELWAPFAEDGWYTFNDAHAMMAFASAGRGDLTGRLLATMERAAEIDNDNGIATRKVGLPVAKGIELFCQGNYDAAFAQIYNVKGEVSRAGGSHAQRDLISQTLIRSAELAGDARRAAAMLGERLELKPQSTLNRMWFQRVRSHVA